MIKDIYSLANKTGCEIHLPTDVVLNDEQSLSLDRLSDQNQFSILDLSNHSIEVLEQLVQRSEIVLWNGPMGMIEDPRFAQGSSKLANFDDPCANRGSSIIPIGPFHKTISLLCTNCSKTSIE